MDLEIRTGLSEEAGKFNTLAMEMMVPGDCIAASALSAASPQCRKTLSWKIQMVLISFTVRCNELWDGQVAEERAKDALFPQVSLLRSMHKHVNGNEMIHQHDATGIAL